MVGGLFFEGVRVFDGVNAHPTSSVLVRDGVVVEVGGLAGADEGAQRIDAHGMTLLPGLVMPIPMSIPISWSRRSRSE